MAVIDQTAQAGPLGPHDFEMPKYLLDELFDQSGEFDLGPEWVNEPEETVLRSDELTRETVAFAPRPVVVEITDEQAEQLLEFHRRG